MTAPTCEYMQMEGPSSRDACRGLAAYTELNSYHLVKLHAITHACVSNMVFCHQSFDKVSSLAHTSYTCVECGDTVYTCTSLQHCLKHCLRLATVLYLNIRYTCSSYSTCGNCVCWLYHAVGLLSTKVIAGYTYSTANVMLFICALQCQSSPFVSWNYD